jgi:ABC-type multidrug transport system permease subunit
VACVFLLVLNTGVIYTPAPWLLAAGEEITLREGEKEIDKKIKITEIIIIALFIASFSIIIITGVIFEAFIGRLLRGVAVFWLNLDFLLLEN